MSRNQPKEFSKNTNRKPVAPATPHKPSKPYSSAYKKCMAEATNAAQKKACRALIREKI